MPHLILEYSSNLLEKTTLSGVFKKCHVILTEMLPTEVNSCISRAVEFGQYYIGEGQSDKAFIHVSLRLKAGRTFKTLQRTSESLLAAITDYCKESSEKLNLQISLEVIELQKTYFRIN